MKIFDSHCHPQFPQYDADREEMIARAQSAGISMICVGTDYETSKQGIALAQKYDNIWATIGIHPNEVTDLVLNQLHGLDGLVNQPKVVGIGEVGLDYYRTPDSEKQKLQKTFLKQVFELAIRHDKPLVLHIRDAAQGSLGQVHADLIEILDSCIEINNHDNLYVEEKNKKLNYKLRGVAHSFTGTKVEAQQYLDRGFYLGFNGIITFSRQYDEVVQHTPLDRILLETDAPYLAPEPYRGKCNEPLYVDNILKRISELKGESPDRVAQITTENCKKLFAI